MRVCSLDLGIRNFCLCVVDDAGEDGFAIRAWEVMDVLRDNGVCKKKPTVQDATGCMLDSLQRRADAGLFAGVEVVAIEQQPCGRGPTSNVKMKCLSHVCQAFFHQLFRRATGARPSIEFCCPKRKLAGVPGGGSSYRDRKSAAVAATLAFLNGEEAHAERLQWFMGLTKRDDAADAFLQARVVAAARFAHAAADAAKAEARTAKRLAKEAKAKAKAEAKAAARKAKAEAKAAAQKAKAEAKAAAQKAKAAAKAAAQKAKAEAKAAARGEATKRRASPTAERAAQRRCL